MDNLTAFSRNIWLHKQLPPCMIKPECQCFEVLLTFISVDSDVDVYISQSINQIENYIYLVRVHQNKEATVSVPYNCKVSARILKKMISLINLTRKIFNGVAGNDKQCYIDFTLKSVLVSQYLNHINSYCNYIDNVIDIMLLPSSKIFIDTLRIILEIHMELLFIFEQYQRIIKFGYSYASETNFGTKNMIQLFCAENKS